MTATVSFPVDARLVMECGSCGSDDLESVLDLGFAPPPCIVRSVDEMPVSEQMYSVELLRCERCTLVQMSTIIDPDVVFPPDYSYSSGNTQALHENFEDLVSKVDHLLGPNDLVVDIGANDGTLLSKFSCRRLAVEPTDQINNIPPDEIPSIKAFFDMRTARRILRDYGPAKVVTACNVLAHVADIHGVLDAIYAMMPSDGMLVCENHDLLSIVEHNQWDTIYHEHRRFYDPPSFTTLLESHGFQVMKHRPIPTHGGSFRTFAAKGQSEMLADPTIPREYNFERLSEKVKYSRAHLRSAISSVRAAGKNVVGVGASARATALISYCGLNHHDLDAVLEVTGSDKIGTYMPGTLIPVVDEGSLFKEQPDYALLFMMPWKNIATKLRSKGYGGTFIVPLPELNYLRLPFSDPRSR